MFLCGLDPAEVDQALSGLAEYIAGGCGGVVIPGEHGHVAGIVCDVSLEADVARLVDAAEAALGRVDVLANNAGTSVRSPFLEVTPQEWDRIIAVNLRGMFLVAQAVARRMAERGAGVIINMSSTNGIAGEEDYAHYNASKAGVLLLTKTMAVELGGLGIRVNALCPGYISTPLNAAIATRLGEGFEEAYARHRIPLGRVGTADEVAAAYAFLASDDASFIHGTGLVIDGGQLAVM